MNRRPLAVAATSKSSGSAPSPVSRVPSRPGGVAEAIAFPACARSIEDLNGGCLLASSIPGLGRLYPLSSDLYVHAANGWVGMGNTNPMARLDVTGSVAATTLDVAGSIDAGSTGTSVAVRGDSSNGPTRGFLGAQGTDDFDGISTADWLGEELGVVGVSVGGSSTDNVGVIGHSNGVGVRGESSTDPANNYAELGVSGGIGLRSRGSQLAAEFMGDIEVTGNIDMMAGSSDLDICDSLGNRRVHMNANGTSGNIELHVASGAMAARLTDLGNQGGLTLYNDAGNLRTSLRGGFLGGGGSALFSAGDGSSTTMLSGEGPNGGGQVLLTNDVSRTSVELNGDSTDGGELVLYDRSGTNNFDALSLRARDPFGTGSELVMKNAAGVDLFDIDTGSTGTPSLRLKEHDGSDALFFAGNILSLHSSTGVVTIQYNRETGTKSAVVGTSSGRRRLFAMESPEVWFEDFGQGQLGGGRARIDLEPIFLETVTIDEQNPMNVFITPTGPLLSHWVEQRGDHFIVHDLDGSSDATFNWRIVAKRRGSEETRLPVLDSPASPDGKLGEDLAPSLPSRAIDREEGREAERQATR